MMFDIFIFVFVGGLLVDVTLLKRKLADTRDHLEALDKFVWEHEVRFKENGLKEANCHHLNKRQREFDNVALVVDQKIEEAGK